MYYNLDFGCINSSTGYHYVPYGNNAVCIVVGHRWGYGGDLYWPGVFYSDWWGLGTSYQLDVGCLNSPNYYLQQELSLWC